MKIKATSVDGGIYEVYPLDMINWLDKYSEDIIHNYISGPMMLGADWDRASVIDHIKTSNRVAVLTGDAFLNNMKHALAVITDKLYIFDIGLITPDDMELAEEAEKE